MLDITPHPPLHTEPYKTQWKPVLSVDFALTETHFDQCHVDATLMHLTDAFQNPTVLVLHTLRSCCTWPCLSRRRDVERALPSLAQPTADRTFEGINTRRVDDQPLATLSSHMQGQRGVILLNVARQQLISVKHRRSDHPDKPAGVPLHASRATLCYSLHFQKTFQGLYQMLPTDTASVPTSAFPPLHIFKS